jgi:hypothetical protein
MSLVEFCRANGLTTVDSFARECYRQSGEADKAWKLWCDVHCDREWIQFWKWQKKEVEKTAREFQRAKRKAQVS